jgi:beta-glucosidase
MAGNKRVSLKDEHYLQIHAMSPDARADLVIKADDARREDLPAARPARRLRPNAAPSASNGGAGFTSAIPRLGIPAIQMADSAYGVTRGAQMGRYSTALPNNLALPRRLGSPTAFEYGALIGRELRARATACLSGGGVNLHARTAQRPHL